MRLINADALKKDVLDLQDCYNGFSDTYDKACIIGVVDEQPTIEPDRKNGYRDGYKRGKRAGYKKPVMLEGRRGSGYITRKQAVQ